MNKVLDKGKRIVDKLGLFNIVWLIALMLSLLYVADKNWACTFTSIDVHLSETVKTAECDIQTVKNLTGTDVKIKGNKVSLSTYTYGNKIVSVELLLPDEDIQCVSVDVNTRHKTIKEYSATDERIIVSTEDGATQIVFSESFVSEINNTLKKDWMLNLEIMALIFVFFVFLKLVDVFFRYKLYARFPYVWLLLALLLFVAVFGNTKENRYIDELNINGFTSCTEVDEEEFFYQSFIPKENTTGIRVRLATYGDKLQGMYELRIYDANGKRVITHEIKGPDVVDNEYYNVDFDRALNEGESYKFTVVKTDSEYPDENMCLWRTQIDHYLDGELTDSKTGMVGDVEFDMYEEGVDRQLYLLCIVLVFYVLLLLCKKGNEDEKNFNKYAICMYIGILVIFLSKVWYCIDYERLGVYDEMAQISYVAYFEENPGDFMQDYKEATLLIPDSMTPSTDQTDVMALDQNKGVFYGRNTETINYLFHPALYYKLMSMTNSVTSDGELVHVNIDRLRVANIAIIVSSIFIVFYLGLTRIKRNMYYHLLFATICVSITTLYNMAPMINNDNLCFLALTIYMLGLIRVSEGKRDVFSYLCIAVGIVLSALTKLTAVLFVALISVYFVLRVCIKEKNFSILLNKAFLITLPVYLLAMWYYLDMYMEYGTFRLSISSVLGSKALDYPVLIRKVTDRTFLEVPDMFLAYLESFFTRWYQNIITLTNSTILDSMVYILRTLVFVLPLALPLYDLRNKEREKNAQYYVFEAVSITVVYVFFNQMIRSVGTFYGTTGRMGSHSRYYLCLLPLFAYSVVYFLSSHVDKKLGSDTRIVMGENSISVNTLIHALISVCALILITV